MFVGGMAVGLYAFIHNKNGQFPGQDEYYATNRTLGAVGLLTAFGGGAVLLLGKHRANRAVRAAVMPPHQNFEQVDLAAENAVHEFRIR